MLAEHAEIKEVPEEDSDRHSPDSIEEKSTISALTPSSDHTSQSQKGPSYGLILGIQPRTIIRNGYSRELAVPLWAAPVEEAPGASGGANPFAGDFGSALWTVLVFLLLLFVLGKFAWGPILAGLQGREQYIRDSLEEARQNRLQSEARLAEYETRLAGARDEAEAMIAEARRDAAALRQREETRAKEEAD